MMKQFFFTIKFLAIILLAGQTVFAQDTILLDKAFISHADVLQISEPEFSDKVFEFKIGEYKVLSTNGDCKTTNRSRKNLFGTKFDKSIKKCSFEVRHKVSGISLIVTEETNSTRTRYPLKWLGSGDTNEWDEEEAGPMISESMASGFSATIRMDDDPSGEWTLFINVSEKNPQSGPMNIILTNGDMLIQIFPASSNPDFDRNSPLKSVFRDFATGFEFHLDGSSIGALQTYGGAVSTRTPDTHQFSGCMAWMDSSLDIKTRHILCSAMATFLLMNTLYKS